MTRVHVGIGTNVDRRRQVRCALAALGERFGAVHASRVYESEAVGDPAPAYHNLVAAFDTDLDVPTLRAVLGAVETRCGRERGAAGGRSRTPGLDLDLLLFGDLVEPRPPARVPRADIERHAFVLGPLAELDPELRHPVLGETMRALWQRLDPAGAPLTPVEPDPRP